MHQQIREGDSNASTNALAVFVSFISKFAVMLDVAILPPSLQRRNYTKFSAKSSDRCAVQVTGIAAEIDAVIPDDAAIHLRIDVPRQIAAVIDEDAVERLRRG